MRISEVFIQLKGMATLIDNSLMMKICNTPFVALVVKVSLILNCFKDLQPAFGQEHQLEREPRSNKYIELPNGHPCMLNPSWGTDTTFVVSDNGTELTCDLCGMGKVLVSNCTSDTFTKCQLLKPGMQRMPHPNFCTTGYPCKACPGPSLTVKKLCDPHGWEDTKCECAKGYFSVNHEADLCQPMPRCSKGFEPRPGASEDGAEMICQKCGHGFYQPNDNSTDLCRRHTNCITTPGTDVSDNICKGDPQSSASPATSSNEGVPSLQPTMPSTQVPTGPSSPTPAAITEPPDPTGVPKPVNETDPKVVYANKVPVEWCVVALVTHVLCFVGGIVFKNSYDQCKKKKDINQALADTELTLREKGGTDGSTAVNIPSSDEDSPEEPTVLTDLKSTKGRNELRGKIKQRGGRKR